MSTADGSRDTEGGVAMSQSEDQSGTKNSDRSEARLQIRLPGFVTDEQIGLGDVVKRATYAVGIRPCGGCQRRAETLNRWVAFRR